MSAAGPAFLESILAPLNVPAISGNPLVLAVHRNAIASPLEKGAAQAPPGPRFNSTETVFLSSLISALKLASSLRRSNLMIPGRGRGA